MNLSAFDLNLLRVLDALLREGSTVGAGERIGLSQPAVSAALSRLRAAFDDPLFVRDGRSFVATDFAREIEPQLRETLAQVSTLLEGPAGFDPLKATARFRISGSDFFSTQQMSTLIGRIQRAAPGVQLEIVDTIHEKTFDTLATSEIDLAFWPEGDFPSYVDSQPVVTTEFVIAAAKDHPVLSQHGIRDGDPIPLDLFCDMSHVYFSPDGIGEQESDRQLAKLGRKRRVVASFPNFWSVVIAVSENEVLARMLRESAERAKRSGQITTHPVPVEIAVPAVTMHMLWHKQSGNSSAHKWLRVQINEEMQRPE